MTAGPDNATDDRRISAPTPPEPWALALRQIGVMAGVVLIVWASARRLEPDEFIGRDLINAPFQWSLVIWGALLALNAVAFRSSQLHVLDGVPLIAGLCAGVASFVFGAVQLGGDATRRFAFLLVHALGVTIFWMGLVALALLAVRRLRSNPSGTSP